MGRDEHQILWESAGGKTPEHWEFYSIEGLLETPKSIAVGVMYPGRDTTGGIPLIKVTDVKNGAIRSKPTFCVSPKVDEEYKRTRLNGTELLITLVGNPGDCVVVSKAMAGWNVARALAVVRLADINLRQWLHHILLSAPAKHLIDVRLNTTVQKTLNLKDIRLLGIPVPPKNERDAISAIIASLDDKIELNRRMNATLEGMAQALFKSWFVDFDPVIDNALAAGNPIPEEFTTRAEIRRRALCANAECSVLNDEVKGTSIHNSEFITRHSLKALFPAAFQQTEEMGWIPEGWEVQQVKDFGSVVCGKTPSKKNADYYGEDVPFIKIPDMHQSAWITDTSDGLSSEGAISQAKKEVPENSICVSCIATVGKVVITSRASHTNQQINSIVPNSDYFRYYLYFEFSGMSKELHDLASGGSATLNLNTGNFSKINILLPSSDALESYFSSVDPQFQKMLSNDRESQTLTKLRDTLLPKLISGELCIEDAEKMVGES